MLGTTIASDELVQTCSGRTEKILLRIRGWQVPNVGEGAVSTHLLVDVRLELVHAVPKDNHLASLRHVAQVPELSLLVVTQVVLVVLLQQLLNDALTPHFHQLSSSQHGMVVWSLMRLDVVGLPVVPHVVQEDAAVLVLVRSPLPLEVLLR